MNSGFKRLAKKYSTPQKVQVFLKTFNYNIEADGETLKSAAQVLRHKNAHCLEAAFLAAAILEWQGYPPLVMSLESKDNLDHVLYVYRKDNKWGSVARSRDEGLHGRKPVFRTLRDLALSYYESYIDRTGCITGYQVANLDDSRADWRLSEKNVWKTEKFLIELKHKRIKFNKKRYQRIHRRFLRGLVAKRTESWL